MATATRLDRDAELSASGLATPGQDVSSWVLSRYGRGGREFPRWSNLEECSGVGTSASRDLTGSPKVVPMSLEACVVADTPAADGLGFRGAAGAGSARSPPSPRLTFHSTNWLGVIWRNEFRLADKPPLSTLASSGPFSGVVLVGKIAIEPRGPDYESAPAIQSWNNSRFRQFP